MKKISVLLAALLVVSLLPATAIAQEDTTRTDDAVERIIENLKDRAEKAIEKRLDTIERVTEALEDAEHLTDQHERTLIAELASSAAGLTELGRQIEDAGTIEELRELIPLIFEDYRIYAVVVPKAHLVVVADTLMAITGRIELVAGSLQDAIDRLKEAGFDTSEAEEVLAEMNASLGEAVALAGPVPGTVLPLVPADWPDPAQGILQGAHSDVRSARDNVGSAIRSAHEVGRILRELLKMG
jgi:ABC-type transporter Mla subunit MlaD